MPPNPSARSRRSSQTCTSRPVRRATVRAWRGQPGGVLGVRRGGRQAAGDELGPGPHHRPLRRPRRPRCRSTTAVGGRLAAGDRAVPGPARRGPRGEHGRLDVGRRAHRPWPCRRRRARPRPGRGSRGRRPRRPCARPAARPVADADEDDAAHGVRTGRQGHRGRPSRRWRPGSWVASSASASAPSAVERRAGRGVAVRAVGDRRDERRSRRVRRVAVGAGRPRGWGARSTRTCGGSG